MDASGNLYIADSSNNRIREVSPSGIINTIAGNGTYGYSGDAGPAGSAELAQPLSLALDSSGNLYVADFNNSRIRKITFSAGGITINTVAGNGIRATRGMAARPPARSCWRRKESRWMPAATSTLPIAGLTASVR